MTLLLCYVKQRKTKSPRIGNSLSAIRFITRFGGKKCDQICLYISVIKEKFFVPILNNLHQRLSLNQPFTNDPLLTFLSIKLLLIIHIPYLQWLFVFLSDILKRGKSRFGNLIIPMILLAIRTKIEKV